MGKIDCLTLATLQSASRLKSLKGLTFFFWSHDHIPPHFNIKKPGHWEVKVNIDTSTLEKLDWQYTYPKRRGKRFHGFTGQEEKQVREFLHEHRADFLREWQAKVHITENLS